MIKKFLETISSIRFFAIIVSFMAAVLVYDTIVNKGSLLAVSPFFAFLSGLLFLNIFACTMQMIIKKARLSLSFYFIHSGMMIVIAGFLLSSFYKFEADIFLLKGEQSNMASSADAVYKLPFTVRLDSFSIEYYQPPKPVISLRDDKSKKWLALPETEIKTKDLSCKVEKFFSDFVMDKNKEAKNRTFFYNNPAVKLVCSNENGKDYFWLFEKHNAHKQGGLPFLLTIEGSDIKDFVSELGIIYKGKQYFKKISVNSPAVFEGYKIYQTSYDPSLGEASLLTVKKDKWLFLVLFGFVILSLGVFLWIF